MHIPGSHTQPFNLLYVNDLVDILYNYNVTKMKLYADDVKLYSNMSAACNSGGSLQNQLDRVIDYGSGLLHGSCRYHT